MFICLYVYMFKGGRFQISVWGLLIWYGSDVKKDMAKEV